MFSIGIDIDLSSQDSHHFFNFCRIIKPNFFEQWLDFKSDNFFEPFAFIARAVFRAEITVSDLKAAAEIDVARDFLIYFADRTANEFDG